MILIFTEYLSRLNHHVKLLDYLGKIKTSFPELLVQSGVCVLVPVLSTYTLLFAHPPKRKDQQIKFKPNRQGLKKTKYSTKF